MTVDHFNSRMLIVIAVSFLVCSLPRFLLNVVELINVLSWYISHAREHGAVPEGTVCLQMEAWTYFVRHISSILMTLNASTGFLIYCMASKTFSAELKCRWGKFSLSCSTLCERWMQKKSIAVYVYLRIVNDKETSSNNCTISSSISR